MKNRRLIASVVFVLLAAIAVVDSIIYPDRTSAAAQSFKTLVALTLVVFLLRGSKVCYWIVLIWSILGSIFMGFSAIIIISLDGPLSLKAVALSVVLAYSSVVWLLISTAERSFSPQTDADEMGPHA